MTPDGLRDFRRDELQLSQAQFARAVGAASDRTVRRWEDGERDIPGAVEIIVELARKFPAVAKWLVRRAVMD